MDIDGVFYCSRCMRRLEAEDVCPHCGFDPRRDENRRPALEIGTFLNDRYQVGAVIGRGGFGLTYAAWDATLETPVALKEYFPADYAERDTENSDEVISEGDSKKYYLVGRNHFLREARVLAMLKEMPGAVTVQDCFEMNETAYIVMEYIHGVTLEQYAKEHMLTGEELFAMLREPVDALIALHRQGILHMDITPKNLLVQEDGKVRLIDFGSSAVISRERTVMIATQRYAPLEQYQEGGQGLGAWTDVYGLSATIYRVLTGIEPQESRERLRKDELVPIGKTKVRLKRNQARAITEGLSVEPEKRIQSMEEFRSILYNLPLPEEVRRRKHMMYRMWAALGILAALTVLVTINFTVGFPLGEGLLYSLTPDGFHITGSLSEQAERTLPSSILGISVTSLDDGVFSGDGVLEEVTVPGSIQTIGDMAFYGCTALESAELEEGVRRLGEFAFSGCVSLHTVTTPESLTEAADNAFENASEFLTIWGGEGSAAWQAAQTSEVTFAVRENYEIAQNDTGVTITAYYGDETKLTLPSVIDGQWVTELQSDGEDVLVLPDALEEITLPERVSTLGAGILSGRSALKKVTLGAGIKAISDGAFKDSGLEAIVIPSGLESIGEEAFYGTYLTEIALPDTLVSIGSRAFYASRLETADLPDSVTEVGTSAFSACVNLVSVSLSEGMCEIPGGLFEDAVRLEEVEIPGSIKNICRYAFAKCRSLEYVVLPEGVENLENYAFAECSSLKYVVMPDSLTEMNSYAFDGSPNDLVLAGNPGSMAELCAKVKGYVFEDKSQWTDDIEIGSSGNSYTQESDEDSLIFPSFDEEQSVAITVVEGSYDLEASYVRLPVFCEEIETLAFTDCKNLTVVEVPDTLKEIGYASFSGCGSLSSFDFGEKLTRIDHSAFAGCESLTELVLPDSLNYLGAAAFFGCSQADTLHISETLAVLPDGVFGRTAVTSVTIPGSVSKCRAAFYECTELKTVMVEEGVRSLWESFAGCSSLESVTLPASLEIITMNTFAGCTSLKDVTILAEDFIINDLPLVNDFEVYLNGNAVSIDISGTYGVLEHLFADSPDVVLHGCAGSMVEEYANAYGIAFEAL